MVAAIMEVAIMEVDFPVVDSSAEVVITPVEQPMFLKVQDLPEVAEMVTPREEVLLM